MHFTWSNNPPTQIGKDFIEISSTTILIWHLQMSIKNNPMEDEIGEFDIHRNETNILKVERGVDRRKQDPSSVVVCFDLQSVFNLPIGFASSFYYNRKINVYNMTATIIFPNKEKFTYCCIWDEFNNSRGGNEIISCIYKKK